jgi:hypothetical protein
VLNYLSKYNSLKKVLIVLYFFFIFIMKLIYNEVIQEVQVPCGRKCRLGEIEP